MRGIILRSPDDMHFHPRQGEMLKNILLHTSSIFPRGVVMGNLSKSVVTAEDVRRYRQEILRTDPKFNPLMTVMLTKQMTPKIIREAFDEGAGILKYIPNNVSTNSEEGVSLEELSTFYSVLEMAQKLGMIFSGHWESIYDSQGDVAPNIEREVLAIPHLKLVVGAFPKLKMIVEHVTTGRMLQYVNSLPDNVGATLTVHHAVITYLDVCDPKVNCIDPFLFCKPIAKTPSDRSAIIRAMASGNPKFFFGSDSAPHLISAKKSISRPAGIFVPGSVALPLLVKLFENNSALARLENFVSRFGAEFYGLPLNEGEVVLRKKEWVVPEEIAGVKVFWGGRKLNWAVR